MSTELLHGPLIMANLLTRGHVPAIKCEACSEGNRAIARCLTCDDFICGHCKQMHERWAILKWHQIRTLAQLRSGEVSDAGKLQGNALKCGEHPEESIHFYCVICEQLLCTICCTRHQKFSKQSIVSLLDPEVRCKQGIVGLVSKLQVAVAELDKARTEQDKWYGRLQAKFDEIKRKVSQRADKEVERVPDKVEQIRKEKDNLIQDLNNIYQDKVEELKAAKITIKKEADQLQSMSDEINCLDSKADSHMLLVLKHKLDGKLVELMAKQHMRVPEKESFVTFEESERCGSVGRLILDDEVKLQPFTSVKSSRTARHRKHTHKEFWDFTTFQKPKEREKTQSSILSSLPSAVAKEIESHNSKVADLRLQEEPQHQSPVELLRQRPEESWKLTTDLKTFGPNQTEFAFVNYVAAFAKDKIVAVDFGQRELISFSPNCNSPTPNIPQKLSLPDSIKASNVAGNKNDFLVILDGLSVKVFDKHCQLLHQFTPSVGKDSTRSCLIVDDDNVIAVGYRYKEQLSFHTLDGSHIKTIQTPMIWNYLTVCQQRLIYTNYKRKKLLVVSYNGVLVISLDIIGDFQGQWGPTGVCCDSEGSIYVAVETGGTFAEIRKYSADAAYLGCVTIDCRLPRGITFTTGGELVIAAKHSVKIFRCSGRSKPLTET
ncbi:uncharacterized protein LOC110985320 [Acanthaster planci]|uniref:Uncharacterized protein LOC110985320 n=1 Tax=Acanthaster planci TaxID=133434 RepID=A0A8B7ZFF9_ACAPL|nr:uncharacterized protein LOC110985320 [Acanthaster planci]XP_022101961.1 uncharacterized protein LOC110985320 [Acanthaster planci]